MFSKDKKAKRDKKKHKGGSSLIVRGNSHPPSILSADLHVVGNIFSEGEIQIDGSVDGDVRANAVILGRAGIVKGAVVADTVHVMGHVTGKIKASHVMLAKSARVVGDVLHGNLGIEQGAYVEGTFRRIEPGQDEDSGVEEKRRRITHSGKNGKSASSQTSQAQAEGAEEAAANAD